MKSFFPLIVILVFCGIHLSVYFFLVKRIIKPKIPLLFVKYFLIFNFLGVIVYFFGRYFIEIPQSLYFLVSLSIGVGFILFVVMLLYQISLLILRIMEWTMPKFYEKRRRFLYKSLNLTSGILAFGTLCAGVIEGSLAPKVERLRIPLKNLGGRISAVQMSDLHIGGLIEESVVSRIVQQINALKPDFIVLTGDIIDTEISRIPKALEALSKLDAPLGVYFILGNHEYFHNVESLLPTLKQRGIQILENACLQLKKGNAILNLAGVYDLFGRRINVLEPNLQQALKDREHERPLILLAHQPKFALEVRDEHRVDLILSGHTHGGQIFPFRFLVRLDQPYLAGLYQHTKNTKIYVNRGAGFWGPPMRILARAEITYFEFV